MGHLHANKDNLTARVRRIAGQLTAIEKAIDAGAPCASVLQQAAAVRGAVNGLMDQLIEEHLREHVARPDLSPEARASGTEELLAVIRRYAK
ncbi:metal/formaldehyde-sensitive transcriptional repressor [Asticcacaulis sp. DW145]|jgi:DNA-binding FrmR family transcriptional regulator|uniref:Metal/formaldehyde-sensitive transcriptional repressor n=1 Tax=Asticcacaulis currens TaxID=2984210 RepID=A0ABT5ID48_9CAUL|nr:metal/formaldehyde-sensitive transcriptional repressor [Asticcacaulis currens]MDC7693912.1 metal/formaldehyde-sensitive transcriptional repressor [Asticcacaulis currens]BEV10142.1 metal/formaldehyde-sensitive transcriptional repressor [Asticcacaulis sp. DW145]